MIPLIFNLEAVDDKTVDDKTIRQTMNHSFSIAVIGAGVIGLTTAVRLLEAGHNVTIFARETPPNTTSDVAAAYWAPHDYGSARRRQWAMTSRATFLQLVNIPESGIDLLDLCELAEEPFDLSHDFGVEVSEIPPGLFPAPWRGVRINVARVDVPTYMPWLFARFQQLGGTVRQTEINDLAALNSDYRIVVNCAGLGARELAHDEMYPIRGQVMRVRKPAELGPAIISAEMESGIAYIIPRRNDVLLGGTFQYYDSNPVPDDMIAEGIRERCALFCPALRHAEIYEHRVGLRPGRREVRLEAEKNAKDESAKGVIIHNYGHAAYGHTLSWGCAAEVVEMVEGMNG